MPTNARKWPDRALWPKATQIIPEYSYMPHVSLTLGFHMISCCFQMLCAFCGSRVAWGVAARASGSLADPFFFRVTVEQLGCANAVCLHSTQKPLARLSYFGREYAKSAVCTLIGLHRSNSKIANGAEIHGDVSFHHTSEPFSFPMTEEMERVTSSALAKEWESICEVRRRAHKLRLVSWPGCGSRLGCNVLPTIHFDQLRIELCLG